MTIQALLERAEHNRHLVATRLAKTPEALRGLDALLAYLDRQLQRVENNAKLEGLSLFVSRAQEDVEVAIVAAFNGMIGVAVDACRDIMEMEMLLREFAAEPSLLLLWHSCDAKERWRRFRPAVLREQRARREGVDVKDLQDSEDYGNHSAGLHVSPASMWWRRGVVSGPRPWLESDFAIAEVVDHSERFIDVLFGAAQALAHGGLEPPHSVSDFIAAVVLVRTKFVPEYRRTIDRILGDFSGSSP